MNKLTKRLNILFTLIFLFLLSSPAFSVEVAPRISDREIIEQLSTLKEGQEALRNEIKMGLGTLRNEMKMGQEALRNEMKMGQEALRNEMKMGQEALRNEMNARFEGMNARFEGIDERFNDLMLILQLFVGIAAIILGFVLRMQWQMNKRQAHMETSLETQKDEMAFIKGLVEKLLPPRGAL